MVGFWGFSVQPKRLSLVLVGFGGQGEQSCCRFPQPGLDVTPNPVQLDGVNHFISYGERRGHPLHSSHVQMYPLVFVLADVNAPSPSLGLMPQSETLSLRMPMRSSERQRFMITRC